MDSRLDGDLACETRLARAGLTTEQNSVTASFTSALPELARFGELCAATDETTARECVENRCDRRRFSRCRLGFE